MTVEKLGELYYINKEIDSLQKEMAELRQRSFYKSGVLTGMPRGGEKKEPAVEYVSAVLEIEDLLNYSIRKLKDERKEVEEFLKEIPDAELRLIMRLRSIHNMRWEDIGDQIGMDRRTASRKYYDYFKYISEAGA